MDKTFSETESDDDYIWEPSHMTGYSDFYKENIKSKVWKIERSESRLGEHLFSFDRKKIYNLFADYPYNLSEEEIKIFDEAYPFWAEFFKWRK